MIIVGINIGNPSPTRPLGSPRTATSPLWREPPTATSPPCRHQRGRPGARACPKDGGSGALSRLRAIRGGWSVRRHPAGPSVAAVEHQLRSPCGRIRLPPGRICFVRSWGARRRRRPCGGAGRGSTSCAPVPRLGPHDRFCDERRRGAQLEAAAGLRDGSGVLGRSQVVAPPSSLGRGPVSPRPDLRRATTRAPVGAAVTASGGSARRRRLRRADGGIRGWASGHGRGGTAVWRLVPPGGRSGTMVVWLGLRCGTAVVRRPPASVARGAALRWCSPYLR
jgi:hypothetical protein